eukprot:gb/GECG01005822.1/.p1 GENE.gb/GECG01005822.1/~~gb/GECG01005822.1/.p1  ORF type:complete len:872 (+),score=155.33 gb/GECG01005822.1/:1-2616(+)
MEEDSPSYYNTQTSSSFYRDENDVSPSWNGLDSAWSRNPHRPMKPAFSGMNGSPPRPPPLYYDELATGAEGEEGDGQGSYFSLRPAVAGTEQEGEETASSGDRRVIHGHKTPVTYRDEEHRPEIGKEDVQGFHHRTTATPPQTSKESKSNGRRQEKGNENSTQAKSTGSRRHSLEETPEDLNTERAQFGDIERFGDGYVGSEALKKAARTLESLQFSRRKHQHQGASPGESALPEDDVYRGLSNKIEQIQKMQRYSQEGDGRQREPLRPARSSLGDTTQDTIGDGQSTTQQNLEHASVHNAIDYLYHCSSAPPPPPPVQSPSETTPSAKKVDSQDGKRSEDSSKSKRLQRTPSFRSSTSASRSKLKRRVTTSDQTKTNKTIPPKTNVNLSKDTSKQLHVLSSNASMKHGEAQTPRRSEAIQTDADDRLGRRIDYLEESFQKRLDEELKKQKTHLQYHFEQKLLEMEKQLLAIQKSKNEAKRRSAGDKATLQENEAVSPRSPQLFRDTNCLRISIAPQKSADKTDLDTASIKRLRAFYKQRNKKLSQQVETLEEKLRSIEAERDELKVTAAKNQRVSSPEQQNETTDQKRVVQATDGGIKQNSYVAKNKRQLSQRSEILEKDRLIQQLRDQLQEEREKFNTFEKQFHSKFTSHCRAFETKLRGKASAAIATVRHTAEVAARQHYNQQLEKIEQQLKEQDVQVESLPISLTPLPMPHQYGSNSEAAFEPPTEPGAVGSTFRGNADDNSVSSSGGFQIDSSREGSLVEAAIPEIVLGESMVRSSSYDVYYEVMNSSTSSHTQTYTNATDGQATFSYGNNLHTGDGNPRISREDQDHLDRMLASDEIRREQSSKMMQRIRNARNKTKTSLRKGRA